MNKIISLTSKVKRLMQWGIALLLLVACTADKDDFNYGFDEGDAIAFTTYMSNSANGTRAYEIDTDITNNYVATNQPYEFLVGIYKAPTGSEEPVCLGTATYKPQNITPAKVELTSNSPLYWPDNNSTNRYGFKVTAHHTTLSTDQTTDAKFFSADKVTGYGYVPLKDTSVEPPTILGSETGLNYYTPKEWKDYNTVLYGSAEGHTDYKTVPLFIRHDRAWITVILKAGEGVDRAALKYIANNPDLSATISSWTGNASPFTETVITPLASEAEIEYLATDPGGADAHGKTTKYDAIVEPFDYKTNLNNVITSIALSDQNYTYSAKNNKEQTEAAMAVYDLKAGQHLTLTVLLSNAHLVIITAMVEPWEEIITTSICDDLGQQGDPFVINNKAKLLEFLTAVDPNDNTKKRYNKQGMVGVISAESIDLDDHVDAGSNYEENTNWSDLADDVKTLNATLNLAGGKLITSSQFLNEITSNGHLLNGKIEVKDHSTATSYVAKTNNGDIQDIELITNEDKSLRGKATVAGLVEVNHKNISKCTSSIPVEGADDYTGYLGGIAAESSSTTGANASTASITNCVVKAKVKGPDTDAAHVTAAGGIVGNASGGYVNNNTFDYGITVSQNGTYFKNIIGTITSSLTEAASGNSWPTNDTSPNAGTNAATDKVDGIIDCQLDLKESLIEKGSTYNVSSKKCRIVDDINIDNSWGCTGDYDNANESKYDINYTLDGNNKTITTNGRQIFRDIKSSMSDITIIVAENLSNVKADKSGTIAPLGFSVQGENTVLNNIKVKVANDKYIESNNPAGIVVWASNGATITNCQFKGFNDDHHPIKQTLTSNMTEGICYVGGIVSQASNVTITQCVCHCKDPFQRGDSYVISSSGEVFFGGIVGGTKTDNVGGTDHTPSLVLTDNESNYYLDASDNSPGDPTLKEYHGAIIGTSTYKTTSGTEFGMSTTTESSGNWWEDNGFVGAATKGLATGKTEIETIGKRNKLKPNISDNW